ncbi:hypothetical protein BDW72DRAFT_177834 [Aspergillus terricola var. indicus]
MDWAKGMSLSNMLSWPNGSVVDSEIWYQMFMSSDESVAAGPSVKLPSLSASTTDAVMLELCSEIAKW